MMGAALWSLTSGEPAVRLVRATFQLLAALTLPHMLLDAWLDRGDAECAEASGLQAQPAGIEQGRYLARLASQHWRPLAPAMPHDPQPTGAPATVVCPNTTLAVPSGVSASRYLTRGDDAETPLFSMTLGNR